MARASPIAIMAAVEAVGARFSEQASRSTEMSSTTSAAWASVDFLLPVRAITPMPSRLAVGRSWLISSVSPP